MPTDSFQIISALAIILIASLIGGRVAAFLRIPRVTGYLLAGLLIGPSFADFFNLPKLVAAEALNELRLISDVALALILMNIGGQLRTENLRRWKQRIFIFSATEAILTGLLVGISIFIVNQFMLMHIITDLSLVQSSLLFGVFTGTISIATAPAATLMVVREYEAEGPITRLVLTLVSLNNLFSVFAFTIAAQLLVTPNGGLISIFYQFQRQ